MELSITADFDKPSPKAIFSTIIASDHVDNTPGMASVLRSIAHDGAGSGHLSVRMPPALRSGTTSPLGKLKVGRGLFDNSRMLNPLNGAARCIFFTCP